MPQIVAHRGASFDAPENTLAAFAKAVELKADWFELDCQLTRDGEVVVCHDGDLKRFGHPEVVIARSTLEQLRQIDIGSWKAPEFSGERIPRLRDALKLARERGIGVYIEIKSVDNETTLERQLFAGEETGELPSREAFRARAARLMAASESKNITLARKVVEEIRVHGAGTKLELITFMPVICLAVTEADPTLRVQYLLDIDPKHPERWPVQQQRIERLPVAGCNFGLSAATPERIVWVHARKLTLGVWTLDEPADMLRMAALGVDAITTNRPDLCRETLSRPTE